MPETPDSLERVRSDFMESIKTIAVDITRLTQAIRMLNQYHSRIPAVDEICKQVLAPDPATASAEECAATVRASMARLGTPTFVVAEWDEKFKFLFTIRGKDGYVSELEGFDLRDRTPGKRALVDVLDNVLKVNPVDCMLDPPESVRAGELARRVIWQRKASN